MHYGCKRARHCGLIANGRSQSNRAFSCVRNKNCCFARCAVKTLTCNTVVTSDGDGTSESDLDRSPSRKRTKEEVQGLWRKAIVEQILLNRMEKENKTLKGSHIEVPFSTSQTLHPGFVPNL